MNYRIFVWIFQFVESQGLNVKGEIVEKQFNVNTSTRARLLAKLGENYETVRKYSQRYLYSNRSASPSDEQWYSVHRWFRYRFALVG